MPCFNPQQAVVCGVTKSGKKAFKFIGQVRDKKTLREFFLGIFDNLGKTKVVLPCGNCVGCRLERSRQWAMRIMHEAHFYDDNCFITLTFNDSKLPVDGSLDVSVFQRFMKRFRKYLYKVEYDKLYEKFPFVPARFLRKLASTRSRIRFFHCGEYGSIHGRPHYHACIFKYDFPDKVFFTKRNGYDLYTSQILQDLWSDPVDKQPLGFCSVGSLTFESAAYVARYILKKVNGKASDLHYVIFDDPDNGVLATDDDGNVLTVKPEYVTMSRRPGIGKIWFDKYNKRTYDFDNVVFNGREVRVPKYYDTQFEFIDPSRLQDIKQSRKTKAELYVAHNTPTRLVVREKLQLKRLNFLPRNIERSL